MPGDVLAKYMDGALPGDVSGRLAAMAGFPRAREVMKKWRKKDDTATWWMEGTIRAVTFDFISRWVEANRPGEYLVVAEQQYPDWPAVIRADIAAMRKDGKILLVEIKADFALSSVVTDAEKLVDAHSHLPGRYEWGVVLYSIDDNRAEIDRWQSEVKRILPEGTGVSRPLIKPNGF